MQTKHTVLIADRYELGELLSTTSLGKIFCAHDFISTGEDDEPRQVMMFAVEPAIVAHPNFHEVMPSIITKLSQKNISLNIAGFHECHGIYWIILDEPCGELLSDELKHFYLLDNLSSTERVQSLLLNLLHTAKYLTPKGGYGFIEPNAIMYSGASYKFLNTPIVIALRFLSEINTQKSHSTLLKSSYCSPQVTHGSPPLPQDDTFSIACIAYHMLNGTPPFKTLSTLEAYDQKTTPTPIKNLNHETQRSLQKAMSWERHQRQTSPYELVHAFTTIPPTTVNDVVDKSATRLVYPVIITASLSALLLTTGISIDNNQSTKAEITPITSVQAPSHHEANEETLQPSSPTSNAISAANEVPQSITQQIVKQPSKKIPDTDNPIVEPKRDIKKPEEQQSNTSITIAIQQQTAEEKPILPKKQKAPAISTRPLPSSSITASTPKPNVGVSTRQSTTRIVIPVNENTFVVGSAKPVAPSNRQVKPTHLTPQGDNVFIVMPD